MSTPSNSLTEFPLGGSQREGSRPDMHATRPVYWSLRRELWENRSLYIAPLIVAAVALSGFVISTIGMPHRRRATLLLDAAKQRATIAMPYDAVAAFLIFTAIVVGIFYCLDALHGERRDRSILFWKSLPVSDRTTVLSKAAVPLAILPVVTFATIVATQFIMLLWSSVVLLPSGLAGTTWTRFNLLEDSLLQLYVLIVLALWHAPIYGWLLLVSGWARRATFLWAALPPFAIAVLERVAFNSSHFATWLRYRVIGGVAQAVALTKQHTIHSLTQLTPGRFLATPGLWLGLAFAAACLVAAAKLRRNRESI